MTTENSENSGFFANNNPHLGHIAASDHPDPGIAMVDLGGPGTIYLYTRAKARELLAAAFGAVKILDPDGAPDAVLALIETDALATILARAEESDIREALAAREPAPHTCADCGALAVAGELGPDGTIWKCANHLDYGAADVACDRLQDAAPDTAQPEDIPVAAACRWCGTTEGHLLKVGTLDDGSDRLFCADTETCYVRRPVDAQPEDIPKRACADCGATEATGPLGEQVSVPGEPVVLRCHNRPNCQQRQAAKAGAR